MNRRTLLTIFAAIVARPVFSRRRKRGAMEGTHLGTDGASKQVAQKREGDELAESLANMELDAVKFLNPTTWKRVWYTNAIQVDETTIAWYGVGPMAECLERRREFEGIHAEQLHGSATTLCGRAWCVLSRGRLTRAYRRDHSARRGVEHA